MVYFPYLVPGLLRLMANLHPKMYQPVEKVIASVTGGWG